MVAVLLVVLAWHGSALAAAEIRVAPHPEAGGFGRMVFDFNRATGWRAAVDNNTLSLSFDAALPGDPQRIAGQLSQWVSAQAVGTDGKSLTLTLKPGLGIKAFTLANGAVVIDVTPLSAGGKVGSFGPLAAAAPTPAVSTAPAPAVSTAPAPPPAPAKVTAPPTVANNAAPPSPVSAPNAAAVVPIAPLVNAPATESVKVASVEAAKAPSPEKTPSTESVPMVKAPTAPEPAFPSMAAPLTTTSAAPPAGGPAVTPDPDGPQKSLIETIPTTSSNPFASNTKSASAAAGVGKDKKIIAEGKQTTLVFPISVPTAAAVFERAGYLWVALDHPTTPDIKGFVSGSEGIITFAEQQPDSAATVVRLIVAAEFHPSVRFDGKAWMVDLKRQPYKPAKPVNSEAQINSATGARLYIPIAGASRMITVVDPDLGDQFVMVPVSAVATGVWPQRLTVNVDVPATIEGIAIEPHAETVEIEVNSDGVAITSPGGLPLSPELSNQALSEPVAKASFVRVLPIAEWAKGGGTMFNTTRQRLTEAAASASEDDREAARMELAHFLLANGRVAETFGILRVIAKSRPDAENTAGFKSLRGAAALLMGRDREAFQDLSHSTLAGSEDAVYWRTVAQTRVGDGASTMAYFKLKSELLKEYPRAVRKYLALEVAQAASVANDPVVLKAYVALARGPDLTPHERAAIRYFEGALSVNAKQYEDALLAWDEVSKTRDREYVALATRDQLELLYRLRKIDRNSLLRGLESLRFAWRGGSFEFDLLMRIAQLYADNSQYDAAMNMWKRVTVYYKDSNRATQAQGHMQETFNRLFGEGLSDTLSPIKTISLFDKYRDLLPPGDMGDQMINNLANRLVSVDLLPQAAQLLDRQIRYRLTGSVRARMGARLALVYLLDHKPDLALEAILRSKDSTVSVELDHQRQQLLARSMADLNRTDDALSVIANDDSRDADLLRAEINWRSQRWKPAADALFRLIPPPSNGLVLTEDQGSALLDLGAALTLANDEERVAQVRSDYLKAMERTSYMTPFDLVTTAPTSGVINIDSVKARVKQAEDFKSFLATYKERLQAGGLGSIN